MIRILQDMDGFYEGGIERFVFNIYKNIDTEKIKFDFLLMKKINSFYNQIAKDFNSKIYYLSSGGEKNVWARIRSYIEIYWFLKKNNYTTIHIEGFTVDKCIHALMAKMAHTPNIIVHSHNDRNRQASVKHIVAITFFREIMLFCATEYWACSEVAARWAFGNKNFEKGKVKIIVNGMDAHAFEFKPEVRSKIRDQLGYTENNYVIGHVGRFHRQKNHIFLVDIFNKIYQTNKNSRLLLVGNGELLDDIRQLVQAKGLSDAVYFYGTTERVEDLYSVMDCFVFPSFDEGLGIAVVEAQLSGLLTICSEAVPAVAQISNKFTRLPLNDVEKWSQLIISHMNDKREKISTHNIFYEKKYDIRDVARKVQQNYENMEQTSK